MRKKRYISQPEDCNAALWVWMWLPTLSHAPSSGWSVRSHASEIYDARKTKILISTSTAKPTFVESRKPSRQPSDRPGA